MGGWWPHKVHRGENTFACTSGFTLPESRGCLFVHLNRVANITKAGKATVAVAEVFERSLTA
jgi:hypothetical protein